MAVTHDVHRSGRGRLRPDWGTAPLLAQGQPQTADECKNGNWETFTRPSFRNQGECVSFAEANVHSGK